MGINDTNDAYGIIDYSVKSYDAVDLSEDRKVPMTIIFLVPFILGMVTVSTLPGFNYAVWGLGIVCTVAFLISSLQTKVSLPKEVICYWLFWGWSTVGAISVIYSPLFWEKYFTVLQFCILIAFVAHYSINLQVIKIMLISMFTGIMIIVVSAFISGEYARAEGPEGSRVAGLVGNANGFALALLNGTAILLYFFHSAKSLLAKAGIIGVILVFMAFIIASGSRKGFIGFTLMGGLWFFYTYASQIRQRPMTVVWAGLVAFILGVVLFWFTQGSTLERRMKVASTVLQGGSAPEHSVSTRLGFYQVGAKIIASNPIVGIGLNQFRVNVASRLYSHSNYIEVFCSTGLPGGIIYYSIFVIWWLRMRRLSKIVPIDDPNRGLLNVSRALLWVKLVNDLAFVSYYSKVDWMLAAILIGWSYHLEQRFIATQQMSYAISSTDIWQEHLYAQSPD